jgi:hypothetical protein
MMVGDVRDDGLLVFEFVVSPLSRGAARALFDLLTSARDRQIGKSR